jgi:proteasome accessory factor A
MSNERVFGLETEYAAVFEGQTKTDAKALFEICEPPFSFAWDDASEHPWFDARGFVPMAGGLPAMQIPLELLELPPDKNLAPKAETLPQQPDAPVEVTVEHSPSVMLLNGSRFYLDHTHPEFCTPECATPLEAVLYDKAGETWLMELANRFNASHSGEARCRVYKNNLDTQDHTYGCHENYSLSASTYLDLFGNGSHRLYTALIPFLISRQIFCGAGKVAPLSNGQGFGFHISQRASFVEATIGLQTTHQRPLINTRDEPHADPMFFRRLHVIPGDSNLSEFSTYLKIGTFGLVLDLLEANQLQLNLTLADPIAAFQAISEDPTCAVTVELEDGRKYSAADIQRCFLEAVDRFLSKNGDQTYRRQVWQAWAESLDDLADDPSNLAAKTDWAIKYEFLSAQKEKHGWDWSSPQVRELDFKYHLLDRQQSLFLVLQNQDLIDRLLTEEEIVSTQKQPPKNTRAQLRMKFIHRYSDQIKAVNWDTIVFTDKQQAKYRWRMGDPRFNGGTELSACLEQDELIKAIAMLMKIQEQNRRR